MKRFLSLAAGLALSMVVAALGVAGCSSSTTSSPGLPPRIDSLNPNFGPIGTQVTVNGLYFGAAQGTSQVTFHGVAAPIGSWSDNIIVVTVPAGSETGDVIVTTPAGSSNALTFTISATATAPTPTTPQTPSTPGY